MTDIYSDIKTVLKKERVFKIKELPNTYNPLFIFSNEEDEEVFTGFYNEVLEAFKDNLDLEVKYLDCMQEAWELTLFFKILN